MTQNPSSSLQISPANEPKSSATNKRDVEALMVVAREVSAGFCVEIAGEVTKPDEDIVDVGDSEVVATSVDVSCAVETTLVAPENTVDDVRSEDVVIVLVESSVVAPGIAEVASAVDGVGGVDELDNAAVEVDDVELDGKEQLPTTLTLFNRHLSSSSFVFAENRSWSLAPSGGLDTAEKVADPWYSSAVSSPSARTINGSDTVTKSSNDTVNEQESPLSRNFARATTSTVTLENEPRPALSEYVTLPSRTRKSSVTTSCG